MANFSSDRDILKYEPVLFGQLHLPGQVLISGTGAELNGTTFTAADADFTSAKVSAGCVIYLQSSDGVCDMPAEIISVDSATQLTVSVIRADTDDDAISPPAADDISYRVTTYEPQAQEVGFQLTEYFGIAPGNPASEYDSDEILDAAVLKQASVFAVISTVYAMLAGGADDENFWKKSLHYQKLFEKARQRCWLGIDTGSDGIADLTRTGTSAKLVRD